MTIDISAETIEVDNESRYANWEMDEIIVRETDTLAHICVTGTADNPEYIDFTPIFEILLETHEDTSTNSFYLCEVSFSARRESARLSITTDASFWTGSGVETPVTQTITRSGNLIFTENELSKISYTDPPLLVGYCRDSKLCLE